MSMSAEIRWSWVEDGGLEQKRSTKESILISIDVQKIILMLC